MRIEKVNENQIRCTLTKEDLANRKLKISELAYGSDKAKVLFRDMMQQASFEFGFEAENIPLMIEAIPVSSECIVLVITKVEDPDELDTRFSKFAPSVNAEGSNPLSEILENLVEGADDVLDIFKKLQNSQLGTSAPAKEEDHYTEMSDEDAVSAAKSSFKKALQQKIKNASSTMMMIRIYEFSSLDILTEISRVLIGFYQGENSLYKSPSGGYLLSVSKSDHTPADFNRACNILAEYGDCIKSVNGSEAFLAEHNQAIICKNAIQTLAQL